MKILIAMQRIFDEVGGGQTFIRNAIERHPEHEFYYFDNRASRAGLPANARPLPISDQYRAAGGLGLAAVAAERPELSLEGRDHDVALLLDMAAAAANRRFDVVEIPDFMPFGALLPDLLRHHGATVDRVAHSLHGALTLSIRTLWQGANTSDLAPVEAYERLAYRSADIRYGISARYAGALAAEEGLPAVVVDPRLALAPGSLSLGADYLPAAPEEMARMPAARRRDGAPARRLLPDLNFVGRQDQIKGPDLFLSLAANIPADQYGAINLFGATVEIEGVSSAKVLSEMAARRGLRIAANRPMGHADVQRLFAEGRGITFVPSRVDTFNLVALESVLNGCPTVISTACGICDFLDEAYPGLPYVKLDPENIWPALAGIQEILDDYEGYRARIAAYLAGRPRPDYGTDLTAVYGGAPAGDAAAAAQVARAAAEIVRLLRTRILPERRATVTEEVRATLQGHAVGHGSADLGPYAPALLGGAEAIRALRAEGGRAFASADGMADAMRTLTAAIEGQRVDRINAFGLLAELERRRGNELLWAVYQLRRFRLSGHAPADRLREVRAVLDQHGLGAEAEAAALLHGGDEEAVYAHLKAQAALCTAPSAEGIELVEHHFRRENPRIAVLVSAYNCAPKVEQFVAGLRSFTPETLRAMEVVVVDSGSPDDTLGALRRALSRPCGDRTLDATIVRTARRETIQAAWNRALTIVRAPYITFLGADEMMRPDALAILAAELDRAPGLDWVQGNGLVCEVNEHGSPVRDVMTYDRRFDNQFMHYLDCCYMGYVGGLYRRAVHDRVGFYNPGFRAAGDNEFKNRALPHIAVRTLPEILGTFRNFPEERTTQSPQAEIEDLRAWHLPRSPGGMRYAFEGRDPAEAVQLFHRSLAYRKSYMGITCTDIELARSVATYLERHHPDRFCEIERFVPALTRLELGYRRLDEIGTPCQTPLLPGLAQAAERIKRAGLAIAKSQLELREEVPGVACWVFNDNRHHQHHNVWRSALKRLPLGEPLAAADLAGPQDLAELASSGGSDDPMVDFETAFRQDALDQVRRLFAEEAMDVLLPLPEGEAAEAAFDEAAAALGAVPSGEGRFALFVAGGPAREPWMADARIYPLGRLQSLRPALAGCRLVALPFWTAAGVEAALPLAARALGAGKPLLLGRPVADRLEALSGTALPAEGVIVCDRPEEAADRAEAFVRGPAERRAAAAAAVAGHAAALRRDGRCLVLGEGEAAAPAGFLEWDAEFKTINRAVHAFAEQPDYLPGEQAALEAALDAESARAKLAACADALLGRRDAPILRTPQSFFAALQRRQPAAAPEVALAQLYLTGRPEAAAPPRPARWPAARDTAAAELAIPACDAPWHAAAVAAFVAEVYLPHLAPAGIGLAVEGAPEGLPEAAGLRRIEPGRAAQALAAAQLVVCPGGEAARLRPSSLEHGLAALRSGRPVAGGAGALWFLPPEAGFAAADAAALAEDIRALLADPAARERRLAAAAAALAALRGAGEAARRAA